MNDSEREIYYGKSLFQWLIPSRRVLKWGAFVLFVLAAAGYLGVQYKAHVYFKALVENDMEYAEIKEIFNQKAEFSNELLEDVPISNDIQQAYDNIAAAGETMPFIDQARSYISFVPKPPVLKKRLEEYRPYLQAGTELARLIEREISGVSPGDPLPIQHANASVSEDMAELLDVRASYRTSIGNCNEAFEDSINAILLSVQCPYQRYIAYEKNRVRIGILSSQAAKKSVRCATSSKLLEDSLQTLNRIEPILYQDISYSPQMLSYLSIYRDNQYLWKNDLPPGETWGMYIDRMAERDMSEFKHKKIPFFISLFVPFIEFGDINSAVSLQSIAWTPYVKEFIRLHYYSKSLFQRLPVLSEIETRRERSAASFDRLRLTIAARLYELETGMKVSATTDLVPKYFSKEFVDRQTGESYQWNTNGELFNDQWIE